jgi:PAS domain S-box-containing protein
MVASILFAAQVTSAVIVVLAVRTALRTRDARALDIVAFLVTFVVAQWLPATPDWGASVRAALFALQPLLIFRLIAHFHVVSSGIFIGLALAAAVVTIWTVIPGEESEVLRRGKIVYLGLAFGLAALVLLQAARHRAGVTRRRLLLAGMGAACLALAAAAGPVLSGPTMESRHSAGQVARVLNASSIFFFFFAFTPPRGLIGRWRRREQTEYVAQSAERDPEEHGWMAAQDLATGATRTLGAVVALVARASNDSPRLTVTAASGDLPNGWDVVPGTGLVGQSLAARLPLRGRVKDCEPDVRAQLAQHGGIAFVAPLVGDGEPQGVVIAVHRYGALFPEDDLVALAYMARHAAIAMDHANLLRERRRAAQEASARRLRHLELRVDAMVDSIRDYAMLVIDASGVVAAWHLGAKNVFGYTRDQVAHRPAAPLFGMTEAEFASWLDEARQNGVADREGACVRADRTTFEGITTIRPLTAEPGLPPGFVVVTRDVTEQRKLEERLRQGQKMEAIGALAGGVAHDFNNILAAIIGHADWLEGEVSASSGLDQVVEIQRSAERGVDLVQQLLAFSRREPLKASAVDLSHQVRDMLPMLRRLIPGRIDIRDETSPHVSAIWGSRSQVEQVILNLAVNARDAMPGEGRLTIRTAECVVEGDSRHAGPHRSHVLLEVGDTGTGMDEATRRRAFEPFFTTKDVGQGTGLGLATVYGIVTEMRGLVDIDSWPGRGTTVRVYFPLADPTMSRPAGERRPLADTPTVLLIEDDASLRAYLAHVLEGEGYRVLSAAGPKAALEMAAEEGASLRVVLSDVALPGMDGPDLVAQLTTIHPGLTAIFMSGHGEGAVARQDAVPAARWLQKPFSPRDLLHEIERAFDPA